jgi:hypothetical protein
LPEGQRSARDAVMNLIAQLTTSWGAPGWAVVACALISLASTILLYRRDVKIKRMETDAASKGADEATSKILFNQLADLREQLGALKARVAELEHREKELVSMNEQLRRALGNAQRAYLHLREISLTEINRLLDELSQPRVTTWPPPEPIPTNEASPKHGGA